MEASSGLRCWLDPEQAGGLAVGEHFPQSGFMDLFLKIIPTSLQQFKSALI